MLRKFPRRRLKYAIFAAPLLLLPFSSLAANDDAGKPGFVYVMTNRTANSVLTFQRGPHGSVTQMQEVSTNGQGSNTGGDPLGSQGALVLSDNHRFLLAVNAGSNEVTSFVASENGLEFASKIGSGGIRPVSVAIERDVVYVVNAGGTPNVTGFRIDSKGNLSMIQGSTMPLPGGVNCAPAQVGITPDGEVVVVTEKATNRIDLFPLDDHGQIGAPSSVSSNGSTPFGFVFGRNRTLIVDEAAASTFSSYEIQNGDSGPTLRSITSSLPDGGVALCWIVRDGSIAYGVNAGTNSISSVQISPKGELVLLDPTAATAPAGTGPIDTALTNNGEFLYTVGTGNGSLLGYRVQNGTLTPVASVPGLPLTLQGIAAF